MTNPSVNVSSTTAPAIPLNPFSTEATSMSPDALLSYCQMQLGSLDSEMRTEIHAQELALGQRTAVQGVQSTLEGFGSKGPTTVGQLNACTQAFDNAIAALGPSDPVAVQLAHQREDISKYTNPPDTNSGTGDPGTTDPTTPTPNDPTAALVHAPGDGEWKAVTDTLSNTADDIKSGAEIKLLRLQDLVSQRQQAVEQVTGMMSKEDQLLEAGAKAIGQ